VRQPLYCAGWHAGTHKGDFMQSKNSAKGWYLTHIFFQQIRVIFGVQFKKDEQLIKSKPT